MTFSSRLCAAALLTLSSPALAHESSQMPQYVIISFDGASFIKQWERSRALARKTGARFTYFLSCVYLLTPETRELYQGPRTAAGKSNVGFGLSREEVIGRLQQIWQAREEGHEIASHACGHFDGGDWTANEWTYEFDQFSTVLRDAWRINGFEGEPAGWRAFADTEIVGFRAPYLATGPGLFEALALKGLLYDASTVSSGPLLPAGDAVTRFALPLIPEGPDARPVIAMDYNLYVRHSDGEERPEKADYFSERAFDAFMNAFEEEYANGRTPLQIGFHFTLMNDGAYWRTLERFAETVCSKADVRCTSYKQYIEETTPEAATLRTVSDRSGRG
ncbi:polysaccharide deacetylase [Chelativorans sp. YIM 93263]|uniref:polysaccharide deacetylase n=1 Tax=Chelativorans sp. YIM 93263 TaxID=2906648 RepID=UPI00237836D2|nr:polysaccharide deacetylase [Chelativorans sp. YIM 93263]